MLQQRDFPRAVPYQKSILAMLSEAHLHHGFPEGCHRNLCISILINIPKEVLRVVGCALSKSSIGSRDKTRAWPWNSHWYLPPALLLFFHHPVFIQPITERYEFSTSCAVRLLSEQRTFVQVNSILLSYISFSPYLGTRLSSKSGFFPL